MLEPRRSRYLRALGVDIYVPRRILPGALPSMACEWEAAIVLDAQPSAPPESTVSEIVSEAVAAPARERGVDLRQLAGELQQPATRRAEAAVPAVAPAPVPVAAAQSDAPKFALAIAVAAHGLLIVDDAPAGTGERAEYQKLLANILFALRSESAPALDIFVWPLSRQPQLDRSAAAARETLAAHLHNQAQRHAVHTVLLLGETAQQWCDLEGLDSPGVRRVASVSALSCLRDPALKRRLWSDIRHLAAVH